MLQRTVIYHISLDWYATAACLAVDPGWTGVGRIASTTGSQRVWGCRGRPGYAVQASSMASNRSWYRSPQRLAAFSYQSVLKNSRLLK